jgi:hypothetical protein
MKCSSCQKELKKKTEYYSIKTGYELCGDCFTKKQKEGLLGLKERVKKTA